MLPLDPDSETPSRIAEQHFIELATRPLENHPAIRDEARGELMERLSCQDPARRQAMAENALARLAKVVPGPWRRMALMVVLASLALAGIAAWQGHQLFREAEFSYNREKQLNRAWTSQYPETDPRTFTEPAEYEAFVEFGSSEMPPDYHQVWTRIDPDNGAWAWREALWSWDQRQMRGASTGAPSTLAEFAGIWKLVEQAARAPRFELYAPERRAALTADARDPETLIGVARRTRLIHPGMSSLPWTLFAERTEQLETPEELRATIRDWEQIILRMAGESSTRADLEAARLVFEAACSPLIDTAQTLGATAEEARLVQQRREFSLLHYSSPPGGTDPAMGVLARRLSADGLPTADYEPGRMAEYAFAERFLALAAAIIILIALWVAWVESIRRGQRVRGLAEGLAPLFDGRDGLWMLGLGVAAPLAWYWGITRLTPLGCRDIGILYFLSVVPVILIQAVLTLLLLWLMIDQTGRWRIARRAALIGLYSGPMWPGWLIAAITALLIPAAGIARWISPLASEQFFMVLLASCGLPLLWLIWRVGTLLFGPNSNALAGVILSRAALTPLLLAAAFLLASHPILLAAEKTWLAKDPITGWDPSRGTTLQEARDVDAKIQRYRELFAAPTK